MVSACKIVDQQAWENDFPVLFYWVSVADVSYNGINMWEHVKLKARLRR